MAIDDGLLEHAAPETGPTLRFYQWAEPTLSLGYFQSIASRTEHPSSMQLPVVRRGSGGGAIVHDQELTYSLVLPSERSIRGAGADIYRAVHSAFIEVLADFGANCQRFADSGRVAVSDEPFLCFQRRNGEDLVVSGYKVLGSAQRRGRGGLLQHGSLLLSSSAAAPELPGINELTSRSIAVSSLIEPLAAKLGAAFGVNWERGNPVFGELEAAKRALTAKYASNEWTVKR